MSAKKIQPARLIEDGDSTPCLRTLPTGQPCPHVEVIGPGYVDRVAAHVHTTHPRTDKGDHR